MKKYNEYKDSGIEWLGHVPKDWSLSRLKDVFNFKGGYAFASKDYSSDGVQLILIGNLYKNQLSLNRNPTYVDENFLATHSNFVVSKNDILISLTGTLGKKDYAFSILLDSSEKYLLNQRVGCLRIKNNNVIINWIIYLLQSESFYEELLTLPKGTKQGNLSETHIFSMEVAFPPLKEQTEIANYLDAKTQTIDKKVKLLSEKISTYKDYRKTLINQTVTKGLDKNVKLKNSGINWIGEIPKHWEVKRLKDLSKFINGYAFNSKEYIDTGIPIIRISNISNEIDFEKCRYVDSSYLNIAKDSLIIKNDILVAMTGATIGKNSIYQEEKKALLNQRVGMIRAKKEINNLFLFQIIKSEIFKDYIDLLCGGSAQENISKTQIENFNIQFPPLKEQQAIANYLDAKTQTIDKIIKNIEKQITTLKELRKTLINEVVTGKVKITG